MDFYGGRSWEKKEFEKIDGHLFFKAGGGGKAVSPSPPPAPSSKAHLTCFAVTEKKKSQ